MSASALKVFPFATHSPRTSLLFNVISLTPLSSLNVTLLSLQHQTVRCLCICEDDILGAFARRERFLTMVRPHIRAGLRYLRMTQQGKQWIANLYAHVFAEEHDLPSFGPERTAVSI